MRSEILADVAKFLVRAWSECNNIALFITPGAIPSCRKTGRLEYRVELPLPSNYPANDPFIKYRLWRCSVFHESMHILKRHPDETLPDNPLWCRFPHLYNVVLDYVAEAEGAKIYPGMKGEQTLRNAIYFDLLRPAANRFEAYTQKLLLGAVKSGVISEDDLAIANYAVEVTKEMLSQGRKTAEIVERVAEILGLKGAEPGEIARAGLQMEQNNPFRLRFGEIKYLEEQAKKQHKPQDRKLERIVMRYLQASKQESELEAANVVDKKGENSSNSSSRDGKDDYKAEAKAITTTPDAIRREYEEILQKSRNVDSVIREERKVATVARPARDSSVVEEYYDLQLIQRLKAKLSLVRRGWKEVSTICGDFDAEEYLTNPRRPFIDEHRLKKGGVKVVLLQDLSSSMNGKIYHVDAFDKYKKLLVALGESLSYLGIEFAIYGFKKSIEGGVEAEIICIKSLREKWSRLHIMRIAALYAIGETPMGDAYVKLLPIISRVPGEVIFITLTDGEPNGIGDPALTIEMVRKFKQIGLKPLAIALTTDEGSAEETRRLAENLKRLGYYRSIAVTTAQELPEKVLKLLDEYVR